MCENTPNEKPFPSVFTEDFCVEWDEACATGRLSLTGLFNMIQRIAGNHADVCRFGFYDMLSAGQAWVLNRMRIRFTEMPATRVCGYRPGYTPQTASCRNETCRSNTRAGSSPR